MTRTATLTDSNTRRATVYQIIDQYDVPEGLKDTVSAQYGITGKRGATYFFQVMRDGRGRAIDMKGRVKAYHAADVVISD